MPQDEILPDKSTEGKKQKQDFLPVHQIQMIYRKTLDPFLCCTFPSKRQPAPQAKVTPIQVSEVNFKSLTATRNQVPNPVTTTARTLENIQPLSSNSRKKPSCQRHGHNYPEPLQEDTRSRKSIHTPFRRYADRATRIAAGTALIVTFFYCIRFHKF